MGKDPAFLFYSSDFLTGTMLMSDEQVGKYMRLLCLQHQKGHLAEKDMLKVCGSYDEDIFSEFRQDEQGLYYNERLEEEIKRRAAYSESRRNNREKHKKNICGSHGVHMETETETETEAVTKGNKESPKTRGNYGFVPPAAEEVKAYCEERGNGIDAEAFVAHYRSKGWKVGSTPMEDWKAAVISWERRRKEETRASPESPGRAHSERARISNTV